MLYVNRKVPDQQTNMCRLIGVFCVCWYILQYSLILWVTKVLTRLLEYAVWSGHLLPSDGMRALFLFNESNVFTIQANSTDPDKMPFIKQSVDTSTKWSCLIFIPLVNCVCRGILFLCPSVHLLVWQMYTCVFDNYSHFNVFQWASFHRHSKWLICENTLYNTLYHNLCVKNCNLCKNFGKRRVCTDTDTELLVHQDVHSSLCYVWFLLLILLDYLSDGSHSLWGVSNKHSLLTLLVRISMVRS